MNSTEEQVSNQPQPQTAGCFVIGNWYQTQAGDWVKIVTVSNQGTRHETVSCEAGIHRYTNASFGVGRVTGSAHDFSDTRNLIVPTKDVRAWPDLVAPAMYENPAEGWTDPSVPDIKRIWELAREVGYAVGVHGSLKRDFDLIAAPWTHEAVGNYHFVQHMCKGLGARMISGPEFKPHGRVAVILQLQEGWFKHIDLSILPTNGILLEALNAPRPEQAPGSNPN